MYNSMTELSYHRLVVGFLFALVWINEGDNKLSPFPWSLVHDTVSHTRYTWKVRNFLEITPLYLHDFATYYLLNVVENAAKKHKTKFMWNDRLALGFLGTCPSNIIKMRYRS